MSQLFNKIKVASNNRSTFDLSHHQVTTSDFGYLIPICYRDLVPNDDIVVKPSIFTRLAPMAVPTFGRIKTSIFHFFVPYRLLYGHWDSFITQDPNNHTVPPYALASDIKDTLSLDKQFNINSSSSGIDRGHYCRVMSNLGLNPEVFLIDEIRGGLPISERFSMFPFLAYNRIYIDYFLDPSLGDHPLNVEIFNNLVKDGGNLFSVDANLARSMFGTKFSAYKKDYFTTARVNPQAGDASLVGVDIASDLNPSLSFSASATNGNLKVGRSSTDSALPDSVYNSTQSQGTNSLIGQFTIEALRAANSLQRYLERNNFVGTKIINRLFAHFGVLPTPERLDMAEYIGGSSFPIQIGDVTSHSVHNYDNDDNIDIRGLGYQAGKGVGAGQGDSVRYHAKEHGVFLSLMSIQPDTGYYQGISRFWQKGVNGDALDYFHPEFENLGYQEILNKELYVPKHDNYDQFDPDGIFGYSPRFSEYKFQNDVLGGDFVGYNRYQGPTDPNVATQDSWHLFRKLYYTNQNPLSLNLNFLQLHNSTTDYDRIFQFMDNSYDHFYFNIDVDVKATRDMAGFGEPSLSATNEDDGKTVNLPYGGTRL